MDSKWLDDFLALSQHGNYSQAAIQRHITQPALSRRIKALEETLGVPLFDRTTTPVTLPVMVNGLNPMPGMSSVC